LEKPFLFRTLLFCVIAGVLAALWIPLAPTRLFDFDAANFALALDYFAPAAHQPQPPGYPLYVGLTKLIHLLVSDVAATFLIAGLLGSAAAILLLYLLGEKMFGWQAGMVAALLLMSNPILWQTAMSDQVRIFIAVISIGVALALWPLYQRPNIDMHAPRRLATAGFLLGLLAGFRPEMLVSMAPLLLFAGVRSRLKFGHYLVSALAVCAGMAPWFIFLLVRVGGVSGFLAMMRIYSAEQAGKSSLLFGASWAGAWKMFSEALWWASLGVVSWIPFLLLIGWKKVATVRKGQTLFLSIWFLSLFLFSIIVHIAASGHSLGFVPILCLAGGWTVAAVGASRGRLLMIACLLAAVSLNVWFFFYPYSRSVREASFETVGGIGSINENALDRIDAITRRRAAYIVSDGTWVSWRILQYYYPNNQLLYIPAPLAPPDTKLPVWLIRDRLRVRDLDPNSELALPSCPTIIWLVGDYRAKQALLAVDGADADQYFITTPPQAGLHVKVGRYRLATSPDPCVRPH